MNQETSNISDREFILLTALLTSLVALSIDMLLPALPNIAQDMNVRNPNQQQLIIAVLFLSMNTGAILFGPLSDAIGRRVTITIGGVIFFFGSILSATTIDFDTMLWGRLLQGFGVSGIHVTTLTIVRDKYSGRNMARIMSFSMSIFIMIPCIAPLLGQGILMVSDWRSMFYVLIIWSGIGLLWLWTRQEETLPKPNRIPLNITTFMANLKTFLSTRVSLGYTVASGFAFTILTAYLMSAQQIFDEIYNTGDMFAIYFGVIALTVGVSSFINGRLVMRLGMHNLSNLATKGVIATTATMLVITNLLSTDLPLWLFMTGMSVMFFFLGLVFGNMNAIAMEPLGQIAGIATAFIRFISGVMSVSFGALIGLSYNGTTEPMMFGFFASALAMLLSVLWANK